MTSCYSEQKSPLPWNEIDRKPFIIHEHPELHVILSAANFWTLSMNIIEWLSQTSSDYPQKPINCSASHHFHIVLTTRASVVTSSEQFMILSKYFSISIEFIYRVNWRVNIFDWHFEMSREGYWIWLCDSWCWLMFPSGLRITLVSFRVVHSRASHQ